MQFVIKKSHSFLANLHCIFVSSCALVLVTVLQQAKYKVIWMDVNRVTPELYNLLNLLSIYINWAQIILVE